MIPTASTYFAAAGNISLSGRGRICAGTFVSRLVVGKLAVPMLFERLPDLRLDPDQSVSIKGWVFRGPVNLPVVWDA